MTLRNKLRKAAELLVELPEEKKEKGETSNESQGKSYVEEARSRSESGFANSTLNLKATDEGQKSERPQASATVDQPQQVSLDTEMDFSTIYQQANVPAAPFTAEQMLEMLATLPLELPMSVKRQMVSGFLKAMGKTIDTTPESIAGDASHKIEMLNRYADNFSKKTADVVAVAEKEIAAMRAQIEERQNVIETANERLAQVLQTCQLESDRLSQVLDFFDVDAAE